MALFDRVIRGGMVVDGCRTIAAILVKDGLIAEIDHITDCPC